MSDYREDPALSKAVIMEMGVETLMKAFRRSHGAISQWKSQGMPSSIMQGIRLGFPALQAFGGPGIPGVSKTLTDASRARA